MIYFKERENYLDIFRGPVCRGIVIDSFIAPQVLIPKGTVDIYVWGELKSRRRQAVLFNGFEVMRS